MMSDSERISDALDVIYPPIPQEKIDEYSDTLKTLARLEHVLKQSTEDEAGGIGAGRTKDSRGKL